jgi:REP element-mobilizing transposase RayT
MEYPGALYHLTARGNARGDIYLCDADRHQFLSILGRVCERYHWDCYAWCLMSNHYQLVFETADANLSRGMRDLNGVYIQAFNRRHRRVGHVLQGRYRAIHIDKDGYLLEVIRYVVLNPVRAYLTKTAGQYPWSSYQAMIDKMPAPAWLNKDWVLRQFGKQRATAQRCSIDYVQAGHKDSQLWDKLRQQIYLGEERFVEALQRRQEVEQDRSEIPRIQRRAGGKPLSYYSSRFKQRNVAIQATFDSGDYTQKEIAAHFGLHYSSVSKIV